MEIKVITKGEIDRFYTVFSSVLKEGFPEYSQKLVDFFLTKDFSKEVFMRDFCRQLTVLSAIEEEKTVGFLVFDKLYGGVSYCNWLGVVKEYRGRGIGRKLMEKWEEAVLLIGGHKLLLLTQAEKNRVFYQKCGFVQEGFEKKSWFGLDSWIFGKVIAVSKPKVFLK